MDALRVLDQFECSSEIDYRGIVNLLNAERNDHLLILYSGDGDGIAPLGQRRSPEGPVRSCPDQVSLDVEGVVDGGVC